MKAEGLRLKLPHGAVDPRLKAQDSRLKAQGYGSSSLQPEACSLLSTLNPVPCTLEFAELFPGQLLLGARARWQDDVDGHELVASPSPARYASSMKPEERARLRAGRDSKPDLAFERPQHDAGPENRLWRGDSNRAEQVGAFSVKEPVRLHRDPCEESRTIRPGYVEHLSIGGARRDVEGYRLLPDEPAGAATAAA